MRTSILLSGALLLAGLTAACQPVQPETPAADTTVAATSAPETSAVATSFALPDGTLCSFAGTGATLAFDGERLNYTCTSPESSSTMLGILGDPVQDDNQGAGVWVVNLATYSHGDDGFTLDSSEPVTFFASELDLADDSVCLHAGFGATLGFNGERLNYTCGDTDAGSTGIIGDLQIDPVALPGVYVADKVAFHSGGDAGWVLDDEQMVNVTMIVGSDMPAQ